MEKVHGTRKGSKLASEDVISSMPDNVITNIMNRLPIRDAVRTSILAKSWRLKWTLLTQLVFEEEILKYLVNRGPEGKQYYDSRIVSRLLLVLKGPVTKFVLYIRSEEIFDIGDLNHWVLFLSRKGIKELTLVNLCSSPLMLPIHLFSCLELTHLKLFNCLVQLPPTFCGFPNLLSLDLHLVCFGSGNGGEFITRCPLLEAVTIVRDYCSYSKSLVNMDGFANLKNLKKLTLSWCELENRTITMSSFFQFLGFLPKLEELDLDFLLCEVVVEVDARKWVPIALPCLNTLTLSEVECGSGSMLSFVFEMIRGSPNLQELMIVMNQDVDADELDVPPSEVFSSDLGNTVGQLKLHSVVIEGFNGSKNEECLIKYLLACSPFLKTIAIYPNISLDSNEKFRSTVKLLKLHRASPIAQVDFYEF